MASLAEFPELIKNVFITKEKNDAGIFAVLFHIRGKPWLIEIDNFFLFKTNLPDPEMSLKFAQESATGLMWGPILEKAWAKVRGSYINAGDGHVINGFRTLAGVPSFQYYTRKLITEQEVDDAMAQLLAAEKSNFIIGASD